MLMSDPVILATSNNVVDRSTICRHLMRYVVNQENSIKLIGVVRGGVRNLGVKEGGKSMGGG